MANPASLKPFKKGWKGGPGRPKNPPALNDARRMTKAEFELLVSKLIDLKPEELGNFKGTVLEMAMASIMQKAIKEGDNRRLEFFVERLFGKVAQPVELHDKTEMGDRIDRKKAKKKNAQIP